MLRALHFSCERDKMKTILLSLFSLFMSQSVFASLTPGLTQNFESIYEHVIASKCFSCHLGPGGEKDSDYSSYETLFLGAGGESMVIPGAPEQSSFVEVISSGYMPYRKPGAVSDEDLEVVRKWIAGGAREFEDQKNIKRRYLSRTTVAESLQYRLWEKLEAMPADQGVRLQEYARGKFKVLTIQKGEHHLKCTRFQKRRSRPAQIACSVDRVEVAGVSPKRQELSYASEEDSVQRILFQVLSIGLVSAGDHVELTGSINGTAVQPMVDRVECEKRLDQSVVPVVEEFRCAFEFPSAVDIN